MSPDFGAHRSAQGPVVVQIPAHTRASVLLCLEKARNLHFRALQGSQKAAQGLHFRGTDSDQPTSRGKVAAHSSCQFSLRMTRAPTCMHTCVRVHTRKLTLGTHVFQAVARTGAHVSLSRRDAACVRHEVFICENGALVHPASSDVPPAVRTGHRPQ